MGIGKVYTPSMNDERDEIQSDDFGFFTGLVMGLLLLFLFGFGCED